MKLNVNRFDMASLKKHRIICLIGKRSTGKSVLLRDIMYHLSDSVDFGVAMTPTEDTAAMFREHMPANWIYNGFNSNKLESMLNIQRDLGRDNKQRDLYVLMDDCMYDKKMLKSVAIRDLFMNGRHYKVMYMTCMQYIMDMPPDLRTNVDYVFALKENILTNKQKLWKYFFGMFEKFEDFNKVMDRCTENDGVLVLDNTVPSNKIDDTVFWYRAELNLPPFTMGKQKFWKLTDALSKTTREIEKCRLQANAPKIDKRITQIERCDKNGICIEDELTLTVNG